MPTYGKPLPQAIDGDKARRAFDPRLVGFALVLFAAVCALLVDRGGFIGGLQAVGRILEDGARLIASVEIPFG